jgi:RNA polymerase sigma-70 factor (ECF subfamily)
VRVASARRWFVRAEPFALYDVLLQTEPSPVIRLNRAVAVAMQDGPAALIDAINKEGELADYQWVHSTKADLYRRLGRIPKALEVYGKALEMSQLEPEKRFLQRRIQELKE